MSRVLLAVSDKRLRRRLAVELQRDGWRVTQAGDGSEAVEGMVAEDEDLPDVVVADARLPGWTGLEILALIGRMSLEIPVVLLVSAPDVAATQEGLRRNAAAVLVSPPAPEEVRTAVRSARREVVIAPGGEAP